MTQIFVSPGYQTKDLLETPSSFGLRYQDISSYLAVTSYRTLLLDSIESSEDVGTRSTLLWVINKTRVLQVSFTIFSLSMVSLCCPCPTWHTDLRCLLRVLSRYFYHSGSSHRFRIRPIRCREVTLRPSRVTETRFVKVWTALSCIRWCGSLLSVFPGLFLLCWPSINEVYKTNWLVLKLM